MRKIISVVIAIVFLVGIGCIFATTRSSISYQVAVSPSPTPVSSSTPIPSKTPVASKTPVSTGTSRAKTYTLAQVKTHNSGSSCWTTINGGVYDVTDWINQHPGGPEAILSLCGTDGSAAFNDQHGGQRRPASELASFKIGTLVN